MSEQTTSNHRDVGQGQEPAPSGWATGFIVFAGVMMIVAGGFQTLAGLVALFEDEFYVRTQNYLLEFDTTSWGWVHLLLGLLVLVAGLAVLKGQVWGRTIGIILAALSALVNFAFIPYYPFWSMLFALALVVSVAQLAALVPEYADQIEDGIANAGNTLRDAGVKQEQIDAVTNALDPGQLIDMAMSVLSGTLGLLTDLFFLITVLLFMAFDTDSTRHSLKALGDRFPDPIAALDNFARGTRSYMGVSASFGLVVAIIDGLALCLLDVPGAFVWAVLAFVTNFIPNVGFIIGVIPPALIALLDSGPGLMVTVIVVYSVINFVIQSNIQPRVVGDSVGLSPTLTFLSLVFWTWVVGPVGALLAVPFSLLAKSLLIEADPRGRWALPLISGKPEPEPPPEPEQAALLPEGTPG